MLVNTILTLALKLDNFFLSRFGNIAVFPSMRPELGMLIGGEWEDIIVLVQVFVIMWSKSTGSTDTRIDPKIATLLSARFS
ncbi:hypothetical protein I7I50_06643 [Histoplasma capsulatum G186AR]|uniref:Uncharacterized protein n=1 Tax=Ajellomyces capsulatus TaxID=5037 RepID=A0A8H7Z0K4_AJECA|nr:hypothetical protein I7I52_10283 [Histoplasma capsulatum]QSS67529.1 hypothetical protein I7I50_06643 [Histoplasma capsulatum G186AR]